MSQPEDQQRPIILVPGQPAPDADAEGNEQNETIESPAKVMRIGSMVRQLLDEVRHAPLDDASRTRMKEIYETSVKELSGVLSSELREEMQRMSIPLEDD